MGFSLSRVDGEKNKTRHEGRAGVLCSRQNKGRWQMARQIGQITRLPLIALGFLCLIAIVPLVILLWAVLHAIDRIERWAGLESCVFGAE
jgi:hypothetical protein